jgi:hypothetical protein
MKQMIYEAHLARIGRAAQGELVALAMQLVEKLKSLHSLYLDNIEAKRELGERTKHLHRRNIALENDGRAAAG